MRRSFVCYPPPCHTARPWSDVEVWLLPPYLLKPKTPVFFNLCSCLCTTLPTGSPWPEEEAAVARSCPWAKQPDVFAALESTGGRGEDAIELLIAARSEPGLEGEVSGPGDKTIDAAVVGAGEPGSSSGSSPAPDTSSPGDGATDEGRGNNGAAALAKGGGKKKGDKAAKKVTRAADCPCGSGIKYKKCCRKKDAAIARGQIAPPAEPESTEGDSSIVDDLGSLVI